MKDSLKKLGIPSAAAALIAIVWMIGTKPLVDDMTLAQYWHQHAVDMINRPTSLDMATLDAIELQELTQGYEFQLIEHEKTLKSLRDRYKDNPVDLMIELKIYDSKRDRIKNKLQHYRGKDTENQARIETYIAKYGG